MLQRYFAVLTLAALVLFSFPATTEATVHNVDIGNFFFSPSNTVVAPGDTVRWTLQSGTHTTTSDATSPKSWDSGMMNSPGQTFEVVFNASDGPGPFPYHCTFHPTTMKDTIFVQQCDATGDANGDGLVLGVADYTYLFDFLTSGGPAPVPLYNVDLNGDCVIDGQDIVVFDEYFVLGLPAFDPYGGYPVATCCDPDVAFIPDTLWAFGLQHISEGQAILSDSAGRIKISNIGSSGEDGVSIDLGEVSEWTTHHPLAVVPANMPQGAFMRTTMKGEVDGVPDQVVLIGQMGRVSDKIQISVDFSSIGATSHMIEVFNDGELVTRVQGHTGPAFQVDSINAEGIAAYADRGNPNCAQYCKRWAPFAIEIINGPTVFGNSIVITQENKTAIVGRYSSATVTAADMPEFTLTREEIGVFNNLHEALGDAHFEASEDQLIVSNIGSSGEDGVSVNWEEDADGKCPTCPGVFEAQIEDIDPSDVLPNGAFLMLDAVGTVNDVPDQNLGTLTIEDIGAELQITPDFSPIGSPTQLIEVYDGGSLVVSIPGHSGPVGTVLSGRWPTGLSKIGGGGGTTCYVGTWPDTITFNIFGPKAVYVGDELRILAENDGSDTLNYLTSFIVKASDIPAITLVGETSSLPYLCGDANGSGGVDIDDVVYLINFIFSGGPSPVPIEAGDANCSGGVDIDDVVYLINFIFSGGPAPCTDCN